MYKPNERHKLTTDNNIKKIKKSVHDPFKSKTCCHGQETFNYSRNKRREAR